MFPLARLIASFLLFAIAAATPHSDLPTSFRQSAVEHSCQEIDRPCKPDDSLCLTHLALYWTNEFRTSQGVEQLKQGFPGQLLNALRYSRALQRKGRLVHQNASRVFIGCGGSFENENLAISTCRSDPVKNCVDAWIASPDTRARLLSTDVQHVSFGIAYGPGLLVFCTQTFARRALGTLSGALPESCPELKVPTGEDGLQHLREREDPLFTIPGLNGTTTANTCPDFVRPEITFRGNRFAVRSMSGECKYCSKDTKTCMSAAQSAEADAFFRSRLIGVL